jgi:hypothetical protein
MLKIAAVISGSLDETSFPTKGIRCGFAVPCRLQAQESFRYPASFLKTLSMEMPWKNVWRAQPSRRKSLQKIASDLMTS